MDKGLPPLEPELCQQCAHACIDVIADEPHAFHAVNPAIRWLVGNPALYGAVGIGRQLKLCVFTKENCPVNASK